MPTEIHGGTGSIMLVAIIGSFLRENAHAALLLQLVRNRNPIHNSRLALGTMMSASTNRIAPSLSHSTETKETRPNASMAHTSSSSTTPAADAVSMPASTNILSIGNLAVAAASLEDLVVHRMEASGDLVEVIGSQSMLSQELQFSQQEPLSQEDNNNDDKTQALTVKSVAQHFGMLTQDDNRDQEESGSQESTGSSGSFETLDMIMDMDEHENETDNEVFTGLDAMKNASKILLQQAPPVYDSSKASNFMRSGPLRLRGVSDATTSSSSTGLGSLLQAVQAVTENSPSTRFSPRGSTLRNMQAQRLAAGKSLFFPDAKFTERSTPKSSNKSSTSAAKKKKTKAKHPILLSQPAQLPTNATPFELTAQRAASMAERVNADADLEKRLLLSMALVRDHPRGHPPSPKPAGHVLPDGFFWAHYSPLEQILKDYMGQYYELSMSKCQSQAQKEFNNRLVVTIRQAIDQ